MIFFFISFFFIINVFFTIIISTRKLKKKRAEASHSSENNKVCKSSNDSNRNSSSNSSSSSSSSSNSSSSSSSSSVIQAINPNEIREYTSTDKIKDMDDPNNILAGMINESVLERYNVTGVPNNILRFKKDDICMIMRNINRKEGLAKNLRVKIVSMHEHCIRVCTLNPIGRRYYNIPRISFTISLPYGRSVKLERKQFPLRYKSVAIRYEQQINYISSCS